MINSVGMNQLKQYYILPRNLFAYDEKAEIGALQASIKGQRSGGNMLGGARG